MAHAHQVIQSESANVRKGIPGTTVVRPKSTAHKTAQGTAFAPQESALALMDGKVWHARLSTRNVRRTAPGMGRVVSTVSVSVNLGIPVQHVIGSRGAIVL